MDVTTYELGDGAPGGSYKVTIFSSGGSNKKLPGIYENESTTTLKVLIAEVGGENANQLTIDLNSKAGRPSPNSTTGHLTAEEIRAGAELTE